MKILTKTILVILFLQFNYSCKTVYKMTKTDSFKLEDKTVDFTVTQVTIKRSKVYLFLMLDNHLSQDIYIPSSAFWICTDDHCIKADSWETQLMSKKKKIYVASKFVDLTITPVAGQEVRDQFLAVQGNSNETREVEFFDPLKRMSNSVSGVYTFKVEPFYVEGIMKKQSLMVTFDSEKNSSNKNPSGSE